jgi:hypothetical protein
MVAAGLAQTRNARGGGIRGGLVPAAACGSQNPPRCRVSGTVGIPVIHGRQDVKSVSPTSTWEAMFPVPGLSDSYRHLHASFPRICLSTSSAAAATEFSR